MERLNKRIGIIGGGAFGTAIARTLALKGLEVTLWCFDAESAHNINHKHINEQFLPKIELPANLVATNNLTEAASDKDIIFLVTPSAFLLETARKLTNIPCVAEGKAIIACLTKGFLFASEKDDPKLILDVLENYLPGFYKNNMVYVSGPSHAEELGQGKITALVSASNNPLNSIAVREALSCSFLKGFASLDVTGVQVCAAAKNVVAIAFGLLEALGQRYSLIGDNTESFLLATGLNEIMIIGKAMGATHSETFASIAGIGDLEVTCRSVYGRNRRFGKQIVSDNILDNYKNIYDLTARVTKDIGYLPEGIFAAIAIDKIIKRHKLKLPLFQNVIRILNKEESPDKAIGSLIDLAVI
ncbi:MAG: NAD(P)-dependent glycerol-3-phosphate dehydrogenase [Spirochaetaceae bacterium]|nr:NAD(P)-dependent glycerol-3-phosphate dehydrogenase [Spirochaetaceae bacterium]